MRAQESCILLNPRSLADEQAWQVRFEATTDTQWDSLAASVRQEIAADEGLWNVRARSPQRTVKAMSIS